MLIYNIQLINSTFASVLFSLSKDFSNSEEAWNALAWRAVKKLNAGKSNNFNTTGTSTNLCYMSFCGLSG